MRCRRPECDVGLVLAVERALPASQSPDQAEHAAQGASRGLRRAIASGAICARGPTYAVHGCGPLGGCGGRRELAGVVLAGRGSGVGGRDEETCRGSASLIGSPLRIADRPFRRVPRGSIDSSDARVHAGRKSSARRRRRRGSRRQGILRWVLPGRRRGGVHAPALPRSKHPHDGSDEVQAVGITIMAARLVDVGARAEARAAGSERGTRRGAARSPAVDGASDTDADHRVDGKGGDEELRGTSARTLANCAEGALTQDASTTDARRSRRESR